MTVEELIQYIQDNLPSNSNIRMEVLRRVLIRLAENGGTGGMPTRTSQIPINDGNTEDSRYVEEKDLPGYEVTEFKNESEDPYIHDSEFQSALQAIIELIDVSEPKLEEPVVVSLPEGVTLGKYTNEDVLPKGMTFNEFVKSAAQSALEPTVSLTSPTTIQFNQTAISNVLNFSYVINSFGGSVESVKLEWRRGGSGSWTELTNDVNATTYTHTLTDTAFNTATFNYRYTVTDNLGGTKTVTFNIPPQSYVEPTLSGFSVGSTSRDRGNIATSISGTISRNSNLVPIESYTVQYRINNTGSWIDLNTETLDPSGGTISETHNDNELVDSNRIDYRVQIVDAYKTTTKPATAINFRHRNFLGFSTKESLTLEDILLLSNSILSDSKSRTVNNVTAPANNYTYYVYWAGAGDLTGVIQDGAAPVLTAFTKLADVSGTNDFGAYVSYRVYKSNATQAFTNNNLQFS